MTSFGVIINIGSGSASAQTKLNEVRQAFAQMDIQPEFFVAHDGSAVRGAVEKCLQMGLQCIVAAGGDGTVNAVASMLVNSKTTLGILPLGTFNHLAKDLNIPIALAGAVAILAEGNVRNIDVASVNGNYFFNNSSIGLYPRLVRYREEQRHAGWNKWLAFAMSTIAVIRKFSYAEVRMVIHGKEKIFRTPFVFVGNNEYAVQGLNIGSRRQVDAGILSIYAIHNPSRLGLLVLGLHALHGTLREHRDFDAYQATEVLIAMRKKYMHVACDGELLTLIPPLQYKMLPKSLRVIAPQAAINNLTL